MKEPKWPSSSHQAATSTPPADRARGLQPVDHAERAIEPAGMVLALEMRAGQHLRARRPATGRRRCRCRRSRPRARPLRASPDEPVPRRDVDVREGRPVDARLVGAEGREFAQVRRGRGRDRSGPCVRLDPDCERSQLAATALTSRARRGRLAIDGTARTTTKVCIAALGARLRPTLDESQTRPARRDDRRVTTGSALDGRQDLSPCPADWAQRAYVDDAKYRAMYEASVPDPESFWFEHGNRHRLVHAPIPRSRTRPSAPGDGLDPLVRGRHHQRRPQLHRPASRRRAATRSPSSGRATTRPNSKRITYRELHARGLPHGQRAAQPRRREGRPVTIYMPMIPEAAYAMLACARLGAVHSIVFGGFSPDSPARTASRAAARRWSSPPTKACAAAARCR